MKGTLCLLMRVNGNGVFFIYSTKGIDKVRG
jgi:hypothetical protein